MSNRIQVSIENIGSVKTGPFGAQLHQSDYVKSSGTPIVTVEHLSERGLNHKNLPLVSDADKNRLKQYVLSTNDIVFSRVGSVDRCSIVSEKENGWLFSGRLLRIRPQTDQVYSPYLVLLFQTEKFKHYMRSIAVGGTMPSLNTQILSKVTICLPPLPEQKAIADILQTWDTAIDKTEALIAAKEKQFGWLRSRLINSSNASREILGTMANISSGGTPKSTVPEFYGGGIPWVSIADMTERGMWINSTDRTLTKAGLDNSSAKIYPPNTVLYAMYASIGECSIASVELSSSQAILGIRPDPEKLHFEYLYYYLNSLRERIKLLGQWGTQSNLNAGMVKEFKIPLPPLPEQKHIAETLNTARLEIDTLKSLANQYRTQKRGLMQKLLTGKWRVKVK